MKRYIAQEHDGTWTIFNPCEPEPGNFANTEWRRGAGLPDITDEGRMHRIVDALNEELCAAGTS